VSGLPAPKQMEGAGPAKYTKTYRRDQ
jgi:hypothetical protein